MATPRKIPKPPFDDEHRRRNKAGEPPCCRWCGADVRRPRRSWCSDACVAAYHATWPAVMRDACLKRDANTCQLCGFCADLYHGPQPPGCWSSALLSSYVSGGADWWRLTSEHWRDRLALEADHVVPLAEDGPNTLDNLRALCVPCHKGETRSLAARRAQRRREEKRPADLFAAQPIAPVR